MSETRNPVDYSAPVPSPAPDHQKRISREKWFEVGVVVLCILAGVGYLMWRNSQGRGADSSKSLTASIAAIQQAGGRATGDMVLLDRHFHTFRQEMTVFDCHIALVGTGGGAPLETAVIWLTPAPARWTPSPKIMQDAVNSVAALGQTLLYTTSEGLEKAAKTMVYVSDTRRPHDKGVAGTSDGWKITYVTYRSTNEGGPPQPALYLVLQRLSAGSNPDLAELNRTLYEAVDKGQDILAALQG